MDHEFKDCEFSVVRDTREQHPWGFTEIFTGSGLRRKPVLIRIVEKALSAGDYSIEGFEDKVAIERKSLEDLFNCCGGDRVRFEQQVKRLHETIELPYLMVEGDWSAIARWTGRGANPQSVIGTRISWEQKYPRVKWMFMPSRLMAERIAFRIFERYFSGRGESNEPGEMGADRTGNPESS